MKGQTSWQQKNTLLYFYECENSRFINLCSSFSRNQENERKHDEVDLRSIAK